MDAATLQKKIYYGYAQAAKRIGYMTDLYRPVSAINPIVTMNKLRSFNAAFNSEDMNFKRPNKYGKAIWWGLFDGELTQVGDYLVNDQDGTFFIASQQTGLPIMLVQCNRTITVYRVEMDAGVGAIGYSADTLPNEVALMSNWPASILQGTKGDKSEVGLPEDIRSPWWVLLFPAVPGIVIRMSDVVRDELGHKYMVSSAELTDMGWRITAAQTQA